MKAEHAAEISKFVTVNQKKMRYGYTTGSCAAAAAGAAAAMLLSGEPVETSLLVTPNGITLHLAVENIRIIRHEGQVTEVSCAVRKDAGDDIDATDGILICADVSTSETSGIRIDGGKGVGRVTKAGLDQPVGSAAINSVPRQMIRNAVQKVIDDAGYKGGVDVVISVPEGEQIASKTFNPRLGIEGGISILGTSGIVYPMSRRALVDTIRVEMRMRRVNNGPYLCLTPGNYGERYALDRLGVDPDRETQCSNFIGESIDAAVEYGFEGILFVSHFGKFVKVAGGIMNTHSHEADCRMELMAAAALRAGADADLARRILDCNTTDDALNVLISLDRSRGTDPYKDKNCIICRTLHQLMEKASGYLNFRSGGKVKAGAIAFSSACEISAATENAGELLSHVQKTCSDADV